MKRLIIAVDCDDVLVESMRFLVDAYNRIYHATVTLENAHEPGNTEWGDVDPAVVIKRLYDLQLSDEYANIKPDELTVSAIHELAKRHELHMITARDKSVELVTSEMVANYFANCFKTIEHVGRDRPKGEVCREIGADILIDDNIRYLASALEHGLPAGGALHFGEYPWNHITELPQGVIQCKDWQSVLTEVAAIE